MIESKSLKDRLFVYGNALILVLLSLVFLYPMWYCICASFSNAKQLFTFSGFLWWPLGFSLMGYQMVLKNRNIVIGYGNTLLYVVAGTILNVFFSTLATYVLSRCKLMFKKFYSLFVVFTMYFGGGMIPNFLLIRNLGLYNSRFALLLPGLVGVHNMIIMRTSF